MIIICNTLGEALKDLNYIMRNSSIYIESIHHNLLPENVTTRFPVECGNFTLPDG